MSRSRILTASGGTRSRPLNVGIEAAIGSHVAFLDDDDLVLGNWVSNYLDAARTAPRRLIRAQAGVQRMTAEPWPDGVPGHRAVGAVELPYPPEFDLADHLRVNLTPFMAYAFPRGFFVAFGGADEQLEVCEDWELAMRAASVLGVDDSPAVTALYRRWDSGDDSYSRHDSVTWNAAMLRVREILDSVPLVLPPGSASKLAELAGLRGTRQELSAVYGSSSWRITAPLRGLVEGATRLRGRFFGERSR